MNTFSCFPVDPKRKRRTRINKATASVLERWIKQNEQYPYPEDEDLKRLTSETGMTEKQVRIWFTNYRNVSSNLLILHREN